MPACCWCRPPPAAWATPLIIAIALATAGVVAVSLAPAAPGDASAGGQARLSGIALVLAAIACEAVFILANRRLSQPVPALALSTLMSAGGLLLCLLPAWLSRSGQAGSMGTAGLAGIAYYALVPTVGGFLLWYAGSARTSGARASLATVWMPVSALLLSALWLHEPIGVAQWLGLACVVLATVCASGGKT
jgi:drug/metabolite transporter (DMT)-like permease